MTRISPTDQVLLLLRAQLERMAKAKRRKPQLGTARGKAEAIDLARVREIIAQGAVSEADLQRALVSALLADEFRGVSVNDAQFQALVSRVTAAIADDGGAAQILQQATAPLRNA